MRDLCLSHFVWVSHSGDTRQSTCVSPTGSVNTSRTRDEIETVPDQEQVLHAILWFLIKVAREIRDREDLFSRGYFFGVGVAQIIPFPLVHHHERRTRKGMNWCWHQTLLSEQQRGKTFLRPTNTQWSPKMKSTWRVCRLRLTCLCLLPKI